MAAGAGKPITIKIAGDEKDLEKSLLNAQKRLDGLKSKMAESGAQAEKTSVFHKKLGDVTGDAGNKVQEMAGKFTQHLGPAGDKVQSAIGGITDKLGGMSVGMTAATGGIAAVAVALEKIGETAVGKFQQISGQTTAIKKVSGMTAEEASGLGATARKLGVDIDAMSAALAKMASNIAKNPEKIEALGIAIGHTKTGAVDMNQTLYNAADAFSATVDPAKRAEIGTALFGKAWVSMMPILAQSSAGLRELYAQAKKEGLIQSDKDLAASKELNRNIRELKTSLDGMWLTIGKEVVPQLAQMAGGAAALGKDISGLAQNIGGLGTVTRVTMGVTTLGLSELFRHLGQSSAGHKALQDKIEANQEAMKKAVEQVAEYQKSLEDLSTAAMGAGNAEIGFAQSLQNTQKELAAATEKYDAMVKTKAEFGAGSKEATAAEQDFNGQVLTTESALIRQAEATVALKKNQAEAKGETYDARAAAADYQTALEGLAGTMEPGNPLRSFLQGLIDKLNEIPSSKQVNIDILETFHSSTPGGLVNVQAKGGPLKLGVPTIVGEEGPELIVPTTAGQVYTATETAAIMNGKNAGSPVGIGAPGGSGHQPTINNFHITVTGVLQDKIPQEIVRQMHEALRVLERSRR